MTRGISCCDVCEKKLGYIDVKKVGKIKYCKECYLKLRKNHREGMKERLKEEYPRIRNKGGRPKKELSFPIIIKKKKVNCPQLSFQEKQIIFKILIKRGIAEEEAKQRMQELLDYERQLRKQLKSQLEITKEFRRKFKEMIYEQQ